MLVACIGNIGRKCTTKRTGHIRNHLKNVVPLGQNFILLIATTKYVAHIKRITRPSSSLWWYRNTVLKRGHYSTSSAICNMARDGTR